MGKCYSLALIPQRPGSLADISFFVTLNWAEKGQQLIIYQHGWNLNQNVVFSAQRKACFCCCYSMNALNLTGCQRSVRIWHTIWYCVHFDTIRTAHRWYKTHSHYLWTDPLFVRRILISRALCLIACLITSCSSLRQSMAWEFNYAYRSQQYSVTQR